MQRPELIIADFILFNAPLFEELKQESPELEAASKEVLKQIFIRFTGSSTAPTTDSEWRVKTEQEFIEEFGLEWKEEVTWVLNGTKMDDLFGQPLQSVLKVPFTKFEIAEKLDAQKNDLETIFETKNSWTLNKAMLTDKPLRVKSTTKKVEFKVGDKVKIPLTKTYNNITVHLSLSVVNNRAKKANQDYLYIANIEGDEITLNNTTEITGDYFNISKDNIELYEEPVVKQKTLNSPVETYPAGLVIAINEGNRPSPTQSASSWDMRSTKGVYAKGNDGTWYWIQEGSNGVFRWTKSSFTPPTAVTPQPAQSKPWTPKDLVGKVVLFRGSGKKYLVEKLLRNNPKNKSYRVVCVSDTVSQDTDYDFNMTAITKLLDGEVHKGMEIVPDPRIQTTPNFAPLSDDDDDMSIFSLQELEEKQKETEEAITYFTPADDEYIDLIAVLTKINIEIAKR